MEKKSLTVSEKENVYSMYKNNSQIFKKSIEYM